MSIKPELLAAAGSVADAAAYLEAGADALLVGEDRFGMRLPGSLTLDEIAQVVQLAHGQGSKVYVSLNNLMTNDLLPELPAYVKAVGDIGVDAVEFNDPSVLTTVKTWLRR